MSDPAVEEVVEELVEEAKGSFDLGSLLSGRASLKSTKTIRIYTDEDALDTLEPLLTKKDLLEREKKTLTLVIDNDELADKLEDAGEGIVARLAEIDTLLKSLEEDEIAAARAVLNETALDIAVTPLPPLIVKSARLEARKHLGLKTVTPDDYDDYIPEYNAQILKRCVAAITNVGSGGVNKGLSIEDARGLFDMLPLGEDSRLQEFVDKVVFRAEVSKALAQDADF